jgi:crotonobetainyl-CoA:carnitine CoA-transferase CaiB-like acyl-CoA transferase
MGNRHPNIALYQTCAAADGTLAVAIGNDAQFARFVTLLGRAELAADPRFASNRARVANVDALEAEIAPLLAQAGVSDWVERLTAAGLPAGPVRGVAEVLADPDTAARGMVQTLPAKPGLPPIRLLGNPLRLSRTPVRQPQRPPHLDEDRAAVLRLLG